MSETEVRVAVLVLVLLACFCALMGYIFGDKEGFKRGFNVAQEFNQQGLPPQGGSGGKPKPVAPKDGSGTRPIAKPLVITEMDVCP